MRKKYKHVFFDLDHTLWDFERNSAEVLGALYDKHKLGPFTKDAFISQFQVINNQLWSQYNTHTISKEELRNSRFDLILEALGFENSQVSSILATEYLKQCPSMPYIFPYVHEVLAYLKTEKQYILHILTNGFEEVQHLKLNAANISHYFESVITSDVAGFQKPDKEYFSYALSKAFCKCEESIMIGDNLEADIIGARNSTIDQIYFNPGRTAHQETITYEISCLSELFSIL